MTNRIFNNTRQIKDKLILKKLSILDRQSKVEGYYTINENEETIYYLKVDSMLSDLEIESLISSISDLEILTFEAEQIVGKYLDTTAQEKFYDDRITICTYITSTNLTWKTESELFVNWRDNQVFPIVYQIMYDVQNGIRPMLSEDELIAELPVLVW